MIRPVTCVCMLLAAGSGLYLYQAKHQAQLLDKDIGRVLDAADAARRRAGLLRAEYALENDPSTLAELADTYLPELKTTQPGQFVTLADLGKRLPAVGAPAEDPAPVEEPPSVPVAGAEPAKPDPVQPDAGAAEVARIEPA